MSGVAGQVTKHPGLHMVQYAACVSCFGVVLRTCLSCISYVFDSRLASTLSTIGRTDRLHEQHSVCWPSVGPQNITLY